MTGLRAFLIALCIVGPAAILLPRPVHATTPEDLVRWIYASMTGGGPAAESGLDFLSAPRNRQAFLSARLAAFYDANDTYGDDLLMGCIDFDPAIPGQDYDDAEIAGSLSVSSTRSEAEWRVDAGFRTFGRPVVVAYSFVPEAGIWKLDDIMSEGNALSDMACTPRGASAPGFRGTGYCYNTGDSQLSLDIGGLGNGLVKLTSLQAGHFCALDDTVRPVEGGWVATHSAHAEGCEVRFQITQEGGIRLAATGACRTFCGQRASLDKLHFPPQAQVSCAAMPGP